MGIPAGQGSFYHYWVIDESAIRQRFEALLPVLDERGRRRFAGAEALAAGRGGIMAVWRATGVARRTIGRALAELRSGENQGRPRNSIPTLIPKAIKVSDAEMASLNITRDAFHPEWNYSLAPRNMQMER